MMYKSTSQFTLRLQSHTLLKPGKSDYTVISDKVLSHKMILKNKEIISFNEGKPLSIILLGSKLNFDSHIKSIYLLSSNIRKPCLKLISKVSIELPPTYPTVYS